MGVYVFTASLSGSLTHGLVTPHLRANKVQVQQSVV